MCHSDCSENGGTGHCWGPDRDQCQLRELFPSFVLILRLSRLINHINGWLKICPIQNSPIADRFKCR